MKTENNKDDDGDRNADNSYDVSIVNNGSDRDTATAVETTVETKVSVATINNNHKNEWQELMGRDLLLMVTISNVKIVFLSFVALNLLLIKTRLFTSLVFKNILSTLMYSRWIDRLLIL
jgi:hypothetical protein